MTTLHQTNDTKSEYDIQAENFLKNNGIRFTATYKKHDKYFPDDKEMRDIYTISLSRNQQSWALARSLGATRYKFTFQFGQSLHGSRLNIPPSAYDVLASLTKSDPESFENFCSNYGYNEDSRKGHKTYLAVRRGWMKINQFFTAKELEELQEIN